jgi:acid phosphatase
MAGASAGSPVPVTSHHVVLVMEENQSYSSVVDNTKDWPNLNKLIAQGALATHYYANDHGSLSDYFMLTTGQYLTHDDGSTTVFDVPSIARAMLAQGVSFRVYAEGITVGYLGGDTGLYVLKHDPFAMLSDIADNQKAADQVLQPYAQFATDLSTKALPEFSFIIPNIDDDAHTGTPHQADSWLQTNVIQPLSTYFAFQSSGDGILIVEFDEAALSDTTNGGGQVAPVFWGPAVKPGYRQSSSILYQHQSMLRTVMELLSLPNPPGAAATAPSMGEFFNAPNTAATP